MNTRRSIILTLALGVTFALASAAQADQWAQGARFAVKHSTSQAQSAASLRAQRQAKSSAFWRLHGRGGVAPGGVYSTSFGLRYEDY